MSSAIDTFKKQLCEDALAWIHWKKDSLQWERKHSYAVYQKRAQEEYQAWKLEHKAAACNTYLPNLILHYKAYAGCTDVEAESQVISIGSRDQQDLSSVLYDRIP